MATEDDEGLRAILKISAREGVSYSRTPIDDRDSIAMVDETVGGCETGRASSKNDDGLWVRRGHEDRARNHTPAATANRWLAASRARGPNI
jgi:hypothetical protein